MTIDPAAQAQHASIIIAGAVALLVFAWFIAKHVIASLMIQWGVKKAKTKWGRK